MTAPRSKEIVAPCYSIDGPPVVVHGGTCPACRGGQVESERDAVVTALRAYLRSPGELPEQHLPWWQGMADAAIAALDETRTRPAEPTSAGQVDTMRDPYGKDFR